MRAAEQVRFILEAPKQVKDGWFVRLSLGEISGDFLQERGPALSAKATTPLRCRKMIMGYLEGYIRTKALERYLEGEGLLDELFVAHELYEERQRAAAEEAAKPGPLERTAIGLTNGLFDSVDSFLIGVKWAVQQVAFAFVVFSLVGLSLGVGVKELMAWGLNALGLA